MSPEEAEQAFDLINKYLENNQTGFDNTDKQIFITLCCYPRKTWTELSKELGYSEEHIRNKATRIYRKVESVLDDGKKISKSNFLTQVERFLSLSKVNQIGMDSKNFTSIKSENSYLQQINNPFIPLNGVVEDAELFFGRDMEIKNIFELLNSGSSVAVIGERAIGKSSLLKAVCREVANQLYFPREPVEINLHNIDNDDDFYSALCESIGIEDKILKGNFLTRELQKHRLVLILDEVEKMTWTDLTKNLRWQLRRLAEGKNAPLRLVIAASKTLNDVFPDHERSPFIGLCMEENIGLWDEQVMREFINYRLNLPTLRSDIKVTFSENDIAQIINKSGGHPQKLMTLCYKTFNILKAENHE